jgi:predicted alpha/beta-hydrolase family hydrolase
MTLPNFKYFFSNKAEVLDVVLHGGSQGMDSGFINKITEASKKEGNSVVAFNFPYIERGQENSSGPELLEEIEALQNILDHCQSDKYKRIRLIGKSLGGVVAAAFLKKVTFDQMKKYSVIIFGYDIGYIDIKDFSGKIIIVQGSKDKFGDIDAVKQDISGSISKDITYFSIEGADHSYRIPETKEPIYEDEAIKVVFRQ